MTTTENINLSERPLSRRILNLLREQVSLYSQLESLAQKQHDSISDDDAGPLLAVLASRKTISARLSSIAVGLRPIRTNWPDIRDRLNPVMKDEADHLWSVARQSIQRLMAGDEQDARLLAARKESIRKELRQTHSSSNALSAYKNRADRAKISRLDEAS